MTVGLLSELQGQIKDKTEINHGKRDNRKQGEQWYLIQQ
jgi:hypothetical protein